MSDPPKVKWLLVDRGFDAEWFSKALQDKRIRAFIPSQKLRKTPIKFDKRCNKWRNRIEIMFDRLKVSRRMATCYDRCPEVFLLANALAGVVIYWL